MGEECVAHGFYGFDRAEYFARGEGFAYGRHVYEDDVAQLALCEVGDADYGRVALRRGTTRGRSSISDLRVRSWCGYRLKFKCGFSLQI